MGNISSRLYQNSEANVSEFWYNLEDMFSGYWLCLVNPNDNMAVHKIYANNMGWYT